MAVRNQPSPFDLWFTSLPYGFKARFTALLPLNTLSTFIDIHPEALTLAKTKIQQVPFALSYPPTLWHSNKVFHVQQILRLTFSSIDEYDHTVPRITGRYMDLQLRGTYSWKHVIQLIRLNVDYVNLKGNMQLENHDYDEFIDGLIKLGTNRNRLNIEYQGEVSMSEFREHFATTIKSRKDTVLEYCTITRNNHGKHFVVSFNCWKKELIYNR